jgi:hypothetical protein
MLGAGVSAKSFEARIADLVRLLGSDSEGEVLAAHGALKRHLASHGVTFTDLGNGIERLANGGLADDEMQRLFSAGYQKGLTDATRKQAEELAVYGQRLDGSTDWEAIALFCQREKDRLGKDQQRQFVDDMASRVTWGREPTPKQAQYLLSRFRQLGGRMKR